MTFRSAQESVDCDCYDALRSDRPYRAQLSRELRSTTSIRRGCRTIRLLCASSLRTSRPRDQGSGRCRCHPRDGAPKIGNPSRLKQIPQEAIEATVFHDIAARTKRSMPSMSYRKQVAPQSLNFSETLAIIAGQDKEHCSLLCLRNVSLSTVRRWTTCFIRGRHSDQIERVAHQGGRVQWLGRRQHTVNTEASRPGISRKPGSCRMYFIAAFPFRCRRMEMSLE